MEEIIIVSQKNNKTASKTKGSLTTSICDYCSFAPSLSILFFAKVHMMEWTLFIQLEWLMQLNNKINS